MTANGDFAVWPLLADSGLHANGNWRPEAACRGLKADLRLWRYGAKHISLCEVSQCLLIHRR
jgi:hypothetical protein